MKKIDLVKSENLKTRGSDVAERDVEGAKNENLKDSGRKNTVKHFQEKHET